MLAAIAALRTYGADPVIGRLAIWSAWFRDASGLPAVEGTAAAQADQASRQLYNAVGAGLDATQRAAENAASWVQDEVSRIVSPITTAVRAASGQSRAAENKQHEGGTIAPADAAQKPQ